MTTAPQISEAALRASAAKIGNIIPGVDNEFVVQNTLKVMNGEMVLKDALGFSGDSMEAVYTIAYGEFKAGRYEEAHKLYNFLCMTDHPNPRYWMALGACRFAMGAYAEARNAYAMASVHDMKDPLAPLRAADCQLALHDVDGAVAHLKEALALCKGKKKYESAQKRAEGLLALLTKGDTKAIEEVA